MKIVVVIIVVLAGLILLVGLGLSLRPAPFAPHPERSPAFRTVLLPSGLPKPVDRFFRKVYGDAVPVIDSVVMRGRATIRPVGRIPLRARFVFIHEAGKAYRHYIEAAFFGLPFLKVDEGYVDGKSFFEAPIGDHLDDPAMNQAANLALWAEAFWFPAILATDPRVRWAPVDDDTSLLFVPFEDVTETFVVRFDPETGLIDTMEAMRYRAPGDKAKILWITRNEKGGTIPGTPLSAAGSAMWLDQGKPWATFRVEDVVNNIDVRAYVRGRGK
jgi:hypothetical protein